MTAAAQSDSAAPSDVAEFLESRGIPANVRTEEELGEKERWYRERG